MTKNLRRKFIALLVLSPFSVTGCGNREGELKGEVFIVTQAAQNLKLGLVDVSAVPEAEMRKFIEERQKVFAAEVNQSQQEFDTIQKLCTQAQDEYYSAREALLQGTGFESLHINGDRAMAKAKRVDELRQKLVEAQKKLENAKSPAPFFAGMPTGVAVATTDAEGKFTMKLASRDRYALVAHASRQVPGSDKEEYYWLVWFSLNGQSSKTIMLSNKNLLQNGSDLKPPPN